MHKLCEELGIYFDGVFLHRKTPYFAASYYKSPLGYHSINAGDKTYECYGDELTKEWILDIMDGRTLTKRTNNNED